VQTVEGLGTADKPHPVQAAFLEAGAVQCGYCTPAMELCAKALLEAVPKPTEEEARDALAGCLCRCGGYARPVRALLDAANSR
jgi:aerobic-type carbon monoxide dehydrogenase small subunit (CoxS/CutS family)